MPNLFCELRPSLSSILSSVGLEGAIGREFKQQQKKNCFFVCLFVACLLCFWGRTEDVGGDGQDKSSRGFVGFPCCSLAVSSHQSCACDGQVGSSLCQ